MPELPEVESVRRRFENVLVDREIVEVEAVDDSIVFEGAQPGALIAGLRGRVVRRVGRKGKYWWFEFDDSPAFVGHLGMNGWVREWGAESMRLHSHGEAPLDDAEGRPRFLKLSLTVDSGRRIALTDSRRLARAWFTPEIGQDSRLKKLGPDAWRELPDVDAFYALIHRRKAPIKAILLDQGVLSGIGNWIADEVLYQGRIAPARTGDELSVAETTALRQAIHNVLSHAVAVDADYTKFPETWMFHHRWGGAKGADVVEGRAIRRETIGGRTTAWVPEVQV